MQLTVIQPLLHDRPFIVDTILECLREADCTVRRLILPIFGADRNVHGAARALSAPGLREWAARILMLVLILLAGSVHGTLVSYLINRVARLAATDRLLGLLFGLVRALVVAGIFVLVGKGLDLDGEKWWKSSRLMPYAEQVASWLSDYAEPAVEPLLEEASGLVRG